MWNIKQRYFLRWKFASGYSGMIVIVATAVRKYCFRAMNEWTKEWMNEWKYINKSLWKRRWFSWDSCGHQLGWIQYNFQRSYMFATKKISRVFIERHSGLVVISVQRLWSIYNCGLLGNRNISDCIMELIYWIKFILPLYLYIIDLTSSTETEIRNYGYFMQNVLNNWIKKFMKLISKFIKIWALNSKFIKINISDF